MKTVLLRIVSVFGSSALGALAGGAVLDIALWKSAALAGFMATAKVVESLLRAFADDGKIDAEELKAAFAFIDQKDEA
jgi:hypothetical protein